MARAGWFCCIIHGGSNLDKEGDNMEKNLKKLTILHSNDLHGDFLAEQVDEALVGGGFRPSG